MVRWLLAGLALIGLGWLFFSQRLIGPWPKPDRLQVGSAVVSIEVRDDDAGRNLGLSGRANLEEDSGMLFIFDSPAAYEFWMKDMNFPLDFVWINDGKVVDLHERVPASEAGLPPMTVRPNSPVNQVLEVNSGWVEKNGVVVGDKVQML